MTDPRPPRLIQTPGRAVRWYLTADFSEDDLVRCLEAANKRLTDDPHGALFYALISIRTYLICQGVPEDKLTTLNKLGSAFEDLAVGLHPEILAPMITKPGGRTIPVERASGMGLASAIITLAGRGRMPEYGQKAAKRLRVREKELRGFRKNLIAERIQSPEANAIYDFHVDMHINHDQEFRLKVANMLLDNLRPIQKRSVEV